MLLLALGIRKTQTVSACFFLKSWDSISWNHWANEYLRRETFKVPGHEERGENWVFTCPTNASKITCAENTTGTETQEEGGNQLGDSWKCPVCEGHGQNKLFPN